MRAPLVIQSLAYPVSKAPSPFLPDVNGERLLDDIDGTLHSLRRLFHHYRHEQPHPGIANELHQVICFIERQQLKIFNEKARTKP